MEVTERLCPRIKTRCNGIKYIMLAFIVLPVVVPRMILADIPLGEQMCGDANCLEPVSVGRTVLKYRANSNLMLSFNPSMPVKIFSKDVSTGGEIWGVEIDGKRGFVNRRHIQETRIFKSQLGHRVTKSNGSKSESNEPVNYVIDKHLDQDHQHVSDKENEAALKENPTSSPPAEGDHDVHAQKPVDSSTGEQHANIDSKEPNYVTNGDSIIEKDTIKNMGLNPVSQEAENSDRKINPDNTEATPSDAPKPEPSFKKEKDPIGPLPDSQVDGSNNHLSESIQQTGDENTKGSSGPSEKEAPAKTELLKDVPTATVEQPEDAYEVIDGTTLFMKESTIPSHEPQQVLQSSVVPTPSILTSKIIPENHDDNNQHMEVISSSTSLFAGSIALQENNTYTSSEGSLSQDNPLDSESHDQEKMDIQPTQVLENQRYTPSNLEILPSITEESENKSDLPTPAIEVPNQTMQVVGEEKGEKLNDSNEQIDPVSTETPNQQVSTENVLESSETEGNSIGNEEKEIGKTDVYQPNSANLEPVTNTGVPSLPDQPPENVESITDMHMNSAPKQANVDIPEGNEDKFSKESDEMPTDQNNDIEDEEDYDDISQDLEDEEEDDDESLGSEVNEERKRIVEQNLQHALETNGEDASPASPAENLAENVEYKQTSDTITKSSNLADGDRNDLPERTVSSDAPNEEVNEHESNIQPPGNTGSEANEHSNENKGLFGSLFGSTDKENGKDTESNKPEQATDVSLEETINDENLNAKENEAADNTDESTLLPDANGGNVDSVKKPGDDIKFYEPGDMLPTDDLPNHLQADYVNSEGVDKMEHHESHDNDKTVEHTDEGIESQTYLNDWVNIVGIMDELLFWMKQLGYNCIQTILWIAQNIQKGAMFWRASPSEGTICCRAMTAECLACAAQTSIPEYCASHGDIIGCEEYQTVQQAPTHESVKREDNEIGVEEIENVESVEKDTESKPSIEMESREEDQIDTDASTVEQGQGAKQFVEEKEEKIPVLENHTELPQAPDQGELLNDPNTADGGNIEDALKDSQHQPKEDASISEGVTGQNLETNESTETRETEDVCLDCEPRDDVVNDGSRSFFQDIFLNVIESVGPFTPEWLHKSLHGENVEGVSPKLVMFLSCLTMSVITLHIVTLIFDKISREKPLLAKIALLDKALFKAKNDLLIVRKELDEARSKMSFKETAISTAEDFTTSTVVDSPESPTRSHFHQPATQLVKEMEAIKAEKDRIEKESQAVAIHNQEIVKNLEVKSQEASNLQLQLDQTSKELKEAEDMVKEVLEKERQRHQAGKNQEELVKAIDTLRVQLDNQKKSVQKYESKIAKRETELKGKVQEVRKLRADAANANLAVDKVTVERDNLFKTIEEHKLKEQQMDSKLEQLEEQLVILNETKIQLLTVKDSLDCKESELETKGREIDVLKETLKTLTLNSDGHVDTNPITTVQKASSPASGDNTNKSSLTSKIDDGGDRNTDDEDGDGWDNQSFDGFGEEEDSKEISEENNSNAVNSEDNLLTRSSSQVDVRILAAVQEMAQYKVDLSKATEACERLNNQLTLAEKEKSDISFKLSDHEAELKVARAAKDEAVRVKLEIEQKHQVLSDYYNQREAELQKQLGLLSAKLGDAEEGSESSAKKLSHLFDELESYKSQCKSYKAEMEEQERSLKSQNAALEKRHHESWVTVRQESRKMADAQNEMQTLRNRLTVAETKLVEREVEIRNFQEENKTLKDAVENLAEKTAGSSQKSYNQDLGINGSFANGTNSIEGVPVIGPAGTSGLSSSDGGSLTGNGPNEMDGPPPDLPPLPMPSSIPHAVYPHVPVVPPMGPGVMPPQFQMHQQPMSNFPAEIMRRPPPLGRRSPPRGSGGHAYSRSPSPSLDNERYAHKNDRRHNMSSSRSDISNQRRTRRDIGSGYDSYGTSGYDYSPPPSPRYSHTHGDGRRSNRHSPDRYSGRSGQSGSEWTDREYYEHSQGRHRDHKSGTPLRDDRPGDKRRQRPYVENGETTEDDRHGYASGSNTFRDRPNHHSRRRENAIGDDSVQGGALQGKHGPKTSSPMV